MIEALRSSRLMSTTSAAELCSVVPLYLLNHAVRYRVASQSMHPTLQPNDVLEIASTRAMGIGDLVVYQSAAGLVCHRIRALSNDGSLLLSGDAAPEQLEPVERHRLRGKVTAVVRDSVRHTVNAPIDGRTHPPAGRPNRLAALRFRFRLTALSTIRALVVGSFGRPFVTLLRRGVMLSIAVRAPLHSLSLYRCVYHARRRTATSLLGIVHQMRTPYDSLYIRMSVAGFTVGTLDGAARQIHYGAVARRLKIDRDLHDLMALFPPLADTNSAGFPSKACGTP